MKISEFARKYNVEISTVRYYINSQLLFPKVQNKQYRFDDRCETDMNIIVQLKDFGFSISEIRAILSLIHLSNLTALDDVTDFVSILEKKEVQLKAELDAMQKTHEELVGFISSLKIRRAQDDAAIVKGLPLCMLPLLICPDCGQPLELQKADIKGGEVMTGEVCCACGYHAVISEGIILCDDHEEDTPFKWFNNVDSVYSATDEYSGVYRILLDKGALYMYQNMPESEFTQMVMFGPFTCNCLLRFCNDLDKRHTYVVIDPSLKRIKRLQDYLSDSGLQLIFMAGGIDEIPLRKGSIDIYMDDYSVTNSLCTYGSFIYNKIHAFLKDTGMVIGLVGDYKDAPKSVQNIKKDHPDYPADKMPPAKFKANMKMNGFELQEMKMVGSTRGNEMHFPRNEVGEQVSMLGYTAIKK